MISLGVGLVWESWMVELVHMLLVLENLIAVFEKERKWMYFIYFQT